MPGKAGQLHQYAVCAAAADVFDWGPLVKGHGLLQVRPAGTVPAAPSALLGWLRHAISADLCTGLPARHCSISSNCDSHARLDEVQVVSACLADGSLEDDAKLAAAAVAAVALQSGTATAYADSNVVSALHRVSRCQRAPLIGKHCGVVWCGVM
jgi:hypothetical protein